VRPRCVCSGILVLTALGVPLYVATACKKEESTAKRVSSITSASGPTDAGPTTEECRALYDRAQAAALDTWNRASKSCKAAEDCVLASKRACLSDCGAFPIAKASYGEWRTASKAIDRDICKTYVDGDCLTKLPMPTPTCPAYRLACERGVCAAK
jgi:hypothetical protein